jgi:hypothetical protein
MRVSNFVGLARPLHHGAHREHRETLFKNLCELCVLGGEQMFSPSFWTLLKTTNRLYLLSKRL